MKFGAIILLAFLISFTSAKTDWDDEIKEVLSYFLKNMKSVLSITLGDIEFKQPVEMPVKCFD